MIIENALLSTVAEGLTSVQHVDSYNRGLISLRDQFCPLITKEIRVSDDAEWYDYRVEKGREKVERDRAGCRLYFICICSQGLSQANIHLQNLVLPASNVTVCW